MRAQLELLRHRQHGASSEKIDRKIEQFELMLEEIEACRAEAEMRSGENSSAGVGRRAGQAEAQTIARWSSHRRTGLCGPLQLPDLWWHVVPEGRRQGGPGVGARAGVGQDCPPCRKRMICRECDTTVAGEMPTLPIERGKPGPGLLAHIMIAKFRRSHPALPPVRDVRSVGDRHLPDP
ncbi:hypothetical protein ACOJBO_02390 [Rhizobium beringeri]